MQGTSSKPVLIERQTNTESQQLQQYRNDVGLNKSSQKIVINKALDPPQGKHEVGRSSFSISKSRMKNVKGKLDTSRHLLSIDKIFAKSQNARSLFPKEHFFHISESKVKYKQMLLLLIRFENPYNLPKTSCFMIEILPQNLRSPILEYRQLTRDIVGFKFRSTDKYRVNFYQVRGTKYYLLAQGRRSEDFQQFGLVIHNRVEDRSRNFLLFQKKECERLLHLTS